MSTISKQWLQQKIAEMEATRDEIPFGLDEADSNTLAALRIALASLEAEAVAYIRDGFRADGVHFCGGIITAEEHERTKPALSDRYTWKHQPLFTAPPAPVSVPDEDLLHIAASAIEDLLSNKYRSGVGVWADIPDKLRRAAMLQGAEPVSNRDELPNGWVACSERMPEGMQTVITSNGFDIGQGWWDGEGWNSFDSHDVVPGEVTHWQPLPSPPAK